MVEGFSEREGGCCDVSAQRNPVKSVFSEVGQLDSCYQAYSVNMVRLMMTSTISMDKCTNATPNHCHCRHRSLFGGA